MTPHIREIRSYPTFNHHSELKYEKMFMINGLGFKEIKDLPVINQKQFERQGWKKLHGNKSKVK